MSFHSDNHWRNAIKLTLPILMGYLAAGIAYGILATNAGMPDWFTIVMSFTVFSGTAQYAAIPFFVNATSLVSVFLSTLLMSLRFIFYTLNIRQSLPESKAQKAIAVGYLTDESFALLSTFPEEVRKELMFKINILGVAYWTLATVIGVILGDSIADFIPHLDFALPCLFAILAYEQYQSQKQWKPIFIALVGFLLAQQITSQSVLLVAILIAIVIVTLLPQSLLQSKGRE